MLTFFGIVPEGSILDVPNAALGMYCSLQHISPPVLCAYLTQIELLCIFSVCSFYNTLQHNIVPYRALGLVYYSYWLFIGPLLPSALTVCISSMAMASSVFLAIKLVILKELCLLCWSTHVINSRLFWSAVANLVLGGSGGRATKKKGKVIKRV